MVFFRNNEMELSLTKLRIGLVIFPLILLTIAPIIYLFLGYPLYYSSSSSSSSNQHNISSPQSSLYGNDCDKIDHDPKTSSSASSSYKNLSNITAPSSSTISSPSLSSRHNHSSNSSSSTISSSFSSRHNHSSNSSSSPNNHNTSSSQPSLYDNDYDDTYHDHPNASSSSHNNHSISLSSSSNLDHDDHQETPKKEHRQKKRKPNKCDLFIGEWIPNHEAPYYTNTTCWAIHEHQNCMKYGRPDLGFMRWRWKPKECNLPLFDPYEFLEIVRGKSMAFVGDSVSRNHVQSLICLLSRVEFPEDDSGLDFNFKRWKYKTYNFTIATFWTTHLVRSEETNPTDSTGPNSFYNLYLDEPDPSWASQVVEFDYIIISSGQWFFRPLFLFDKGKMIGCLYCYIPGVRNVGAHFAYRRALRTMFKTILGLENFKGEVFLRTFAPSHFENGDWDKGGNCLRTRPYSNETDLEGMNLETHNIQIDEFRIAKRKENKNSGLNFRLLDVTQAMLLRPDGHPSRFGHKPEDKVILYNDCVHWCLPGPIDSWNDFLLEMLKNKEFGRLKRYNIIEI